MTKITRGMIAVVTGGGAGMGRDLCVQLAMLGVRVATCDVNEGKLAETVAEANLASPAANIFTFKCDVSKEDQCIAFKNATLQHFSSKHVNLLFNNAGIGAGGSFVSGSREDWEACFNVCWGGVYYMSRAFIPSLLAADSGHITNTSSVNGFWASLGTPAILSLFALPHKTLPVLPGPDSAHTAYSAAKFAVKGFTEALLNDMRLNAPHIGVSLVCPGHIGTDIAINSMLKSLEIVGDVALDGLKKRILENADTPEGVKDHVRNADVDQMKAILQVVGSEFKNTGMASADAATYILNAMQAGQWRVLVGKDAEALDAWVRKDPEGVYTVETMEEIRKGIFQGQGDNSNLASQQEKLGLLQPETVASRL
jgi:NAD(P)-dependent dehydrogenase (short-subunit alcohol dehydrogenase family)